MDIIDLEKPENPKYEIQNGFLIAEIIFFVFAVMGFLFKIMHWPGGSFFLIIGLGFFSTLLFPIGLFYKFWQIKLINLFVSIVSIGILFKFMAWPGSKIFLLIGLISTLGILVFLYLLNIKHKGFTKQNKFISFRIISLTLLCWLLNFMTAQTYYRTFINNDPIGATLYEKAYDEPSNKDAQKAYQSYRKSLNSPYSIDSTNVSK